MPCPVRYPGLPCHLSGVGYTARPALLGSASLVLQSGHGAQFPALTAGQFFFAEVVDACGDVVDVDGDTLAIVRDSPTCDCFASNSRVRYVSDSREAILAIAAEVPFDVVEPLEWDCATRTLSINCAKLAEFIATPCADPP